MPINTVTADRIEATLITELVQVLEECTNMADGRREQVTWVLSAEQVRAIIAEIGCTRIARLVLRAGGWAPAPGDSDAWCWRHKHPIKEKMVVLQNIEDLTIAARDLDPHGVLGLDR